MAKRNFPHPVLDPEGEDYPDCAVQFSASMNVRKTEYQFNCDFNIGSDTLLDCISAGEAAYAVQISAPWTGQRSIVTSDKPSFSIVIPEETLRQDVTLKPMVVASRSFILASDEFNPMFHGLEFPVRKGVILAWDHSVEFDATKLLDDLKNVGSIIQIIKSPKDDGLVHYDLSGSKIDIWLPVTDYQTYVQFKDHVAYRRILLCMFAIPAIAYALKEIGESKDENPRWATILKKHMEDLKLTREYEDDPWILAQLLLGMPVSKAMDAIVAFENQEGD